MLLIFSARETFLYTAYEYQKMVGNDVKTFVEIPFLLNMGFSFTITVITMVLISLAGPRINPKAFELDKTMFKLSPKLIAMVVFISAGHFNALCKILVI